MIIALAAAAATPAFAQALSPAAPAAGMGEAEKDHALKTAMAGMASLQMADLALQKAHEARVKDFAQFEHDEQTTVADILKSMDSSLTPPAPDAATAQTIDKLRGLSGAAFDKAFVAGQIEGHQKLLAIQEDYLKAGRDRETINATKLMRGMIREHLVLLGELHKMVG
jgi:predicted outer membrane protein